MGKGGQLCGDGWQRLLVAIAALIQRSNYYVVDLKLT